MLRVSSSQSIPRIKQVQRKIQIPDQPQEECDKLPKKAGLRKEPICDKLLVGASHRRPNITSSTPSKKQGERKGKEARKKGLRKRTKSRGHGTLNMLDIEHVKCVDTEKIDIKDKSIENEFGTFGGLPVSSEKVWKVSQRVSSSPSRGTQQHKTEVERAGTYRAVIKFENPCSKRLAFWKYMLGDENPVQVKAWLLNKRIGMATASFKKNISFEHGRIHFDFTIDPREVRKFPIEFSVEMTSTAYRFASFYCVVELHKINVQTLVSERHSSSAMSVGISLLDVSHVVLEGEDQSHMIRQTQMLRAKSAHLKKSEERKLKHRRHRTASP